MVSHLGVNYLSGRLRHDDVGLLNRHMTVDAPAHDRSTHLPRLAAALPLMTAQAFLRIRFERLSGGVNVVTS
jgi:hypothetical protein